MRERWGDALRPHTKDAASLDLVMLVSDGLYFNNALAGIGGPDIPVSVGADQLSMASTSSAAGASSPSRLPATLPPCSRKSLIAALG